ncbi:MAG: chemotaxis protein CheX, partial [Fimbriiglobus sp.]|nr:chemotaxis protein CheX [Fimbriiglobus sp.]
AFFDTPSAEVTPAELADALGELANMVGGNLKALLPDGCRLSLPSVEPGAGPPPTDAWAFRSGGSSLWVSVRTKTAG